MCRSNARSNAAPAAAWVRLSACLELTAQPVADQVAVQTENARIADARELRLARRRPAAELQQLALQLDQGHATSVARL